MTLPEKIKKIKTNQGMTYVELIVVLGIFAAMTSVAIFNYGSFQDKIEIRNLASDVALKFVEAQKSAVAGKLHSAADADWKPSYGVFMSTNNPDNKTFYYFADLDSLHNFDPSQNCTSVSECLERVQIAKGSYVESVSVSGDGCLLIDSLIVTFTRPDLIPAISGEPVAGCSPNSGQIVLKSAKGETATIEIHSSGKIEIQ